MADIDIRRTHSLGLEGARAAAGRLATQLGTRFGLSGRWEGNVMHFERPGVTGSLTLTDKDLHLTVALGMLMKAMKGNIKAEVEEEMTSLFDILKNGPGPH